ncbi:MAG: alpha/beta hydrolase family protein [Prosthecobacter sp.]
MRSLLFLLALSSAMAADELTVLDPASKPAEAFEGWLVREFNELCDKRSAAFEVMIKSEKACKAWQEERRAFFLERIGGLPERTRLNPQITGTLTGKGYRVEKIILETRPAFHLTANLYLPDTPPPWPAVLVPCGHSHEGKAVGQYQLICMLLARHGMAAMCYDPIGQGERYQMLDLAKERAVFDDAPHVKVPHPNVRLMCTTEHTMTAISSALIGANAAQFRIWDGMRVIDYLQSRPDILADKIGCTGNSGGGTETAYLMALDDRILAAAPGCYLTTFKKLIETKGPQDGEQNIAGQIAFGMDEADYCIMRAPKPTLICAGTRDVTFDFGGTWELFRDAKRFYSRIGHPDMIDLAAPDAPHGFTLQLREAVTRFMARHLLGKDIVVREIEKLPDSFDDNQLRDLSKPDWTPEQLQCTPKGQVRLLPGERSVFQINAETAAKLKKTRESGLGPKTIIEAIGASETISEPQVESIGKIAREGFSIEKLALKVENAFQLPALLYTPAKPNGQSILYLHGESLKADSDAIEQFVKAGNLVLAAELRGIGETETGLRRKAFGAGRFGRDNLEILTAYLMGKSFTGMRADDVRTWARYLKTKTITVSLIATGEAAIPALHAAAVEPVAFTKITLRRMITSYESLVGEGETFDQTVNMIHGVLRHYDLPDLIRLIGNERVRIEEPVNGMGHPVRER